MPIYEYECPGYHRCEVFAKVEDREHQMICPYCGQIALRIMSASKVVVSGEEHIDENLTDARDKKPFLVKSQAHKRQRLKDLGLVQKEPTYEYRQRHADLHRKGSGRLTFQMR